MRNNKVRIKKEIAENLNMTTEKAEELVVVLLKKYRIPQSDFLSILFENGMPVIWTKKESIDCDRDLVHSNLRLP